MEHSDKNNDIKQHSAEPEEQLTEKQDNLDIVKSPETPVTSETPDVPETPESTESQETQDSSDSSDSPDSSDSTSSVDAADEETIIEEKARLRRERRNRVWFVTKYVLVNICRAILSITFLFSAFTKANDPVGFVIKLRDYAGALGMTTIPDYLLYVPAILLTIVETILGIYLFVGVKRRRRVAALATLFMMIMTAVTVWIAIKNPVSDCGCFGDAVILSNNQTLVKNIILLAMAVFITANYKMMFRLIHRDWNWIITIPVVVGAVALFSYCTYMLPIVDFLPFAEGTDLRQTVKTGDALDMNYKVSIVYTNGTDTLMLSPEDDDPDSTVWKYVETRNELLDDHLEATTDFYVVDQDGDDITIDILENDGYTFLVTVPDLKETAVEISGYLNDLYDYCNRFGYQFYFISNAADADTKHAWTRNTAAQYPLCESDDRMLWQMVRDNPGLILIDSGKVIKKWSRLGFPVIDYNKELQPEYIQELILSKRYAAKPLRFDQSQE